MISDHAKGTWVRGAIVLLLLSSVLVSPAAARASNLPAVTRSAAQVGGPIMADTTWTAANSPYIAGNSVLVMENVTLTIEPGMTVKFDPGKALQVDGIVVTSLADDATAGDGFCTVREAINNANADGDTTGGDCSVGTGADTITFAVAGIITLSAELPDITDADGLTIDGGGSVTVSGNDAVGVLQVYDGAVLHVVNITIANGNAASGGGINNTFGTLSVTNSTLRNNSAESGGGINNAGGQVSVINSTVSENSAGSGGGGINNAFGTLSVTNSTLRNNNTAFSGGGINNLIGPVTVTNSTVSENSAGSGGGGMYNVGGHVSVTNSTLSENSADAGAGIVNATGTLTVTNSTVRENSASSDVGGIFNVGGTVNDVFTPARLSVIQSTLSHNSANGGRAGGIYNFMGEVRVINSTLSHNSASTFGGGIMNFWGPVGLIHSTLSHNSGGIYNHSLGETALFNTIIANSQVAPDCVNLNDIPIISGGRNLVGDGSCGFLPTGDPLLGALQYNGGPTETHALLAGSPALDAGDDEFCAALPVNNLDQRGVVRPQGPACDIGAFELEDPTTVEGRSKLYIPSLYR